MRTAADEAAITASVQAFVKLQLAPIAQSIDTATSRIDMTMDKALIHQVFTDLARGQLTNSEKVFARSIFRGLAVTP